ncbi:WhiB family transcriptional regulator [Streptomyces agglomeratus]|uniref:WhiB family transcriptional regulator n=1 Tax=Streptomyces agglomeratus TaxID=285458 RepID=UPI0008546B31|nr:WhiB family transcriptional regulator [Streptomyces agglomeratus]OEJ23064.1 WhiB family transcriptional regulator [Streptomyces agglomeratus]
MTSSSAQWIEGAACRSSDKEDLFADAARQNSARTVCFGCPVRIACLIEALDNRIEFGVWGGMTERERRALLRRRPHVTSWRQVLQAAQAAHEQSRAG